MYTRESMLRDWLYLLVYGMLGSLYLGILMTGYMVGFALLIVLIGIPIIQFTTRFARWLTVVDRRLMSAFFENEPLPADDMNPDGVASRVYLGAKGLASQAALVVLSMLIPLFVGEWLLGRLSINTGDFTLRLTDMLTDVLTRFNASTLPPSTEDEKAKSQPQTEIFFESDNDVVYGLGDDGELIRQERK